MDDLVPGLRADPLATVRAVIRRGWRWATLAAIALVVLGVVFGRRANWGDVATWVVAVTALLAFLAAMFAGLVTYEVLRVELGRDRVAAVERRQTEDERRRGQASQVAAWFGQWRGISPWPELGAVIWNASTLPVYDVRVSFCVPVPEASGLTWRQGERYSSPELMQILPPGEHHAGIPSQVYDAQQADGNKPKWLIAIEFTDTNGHRWLRDPRGRLSPAGGLPEPATMLR